MFPFRALVTAALLAGLCTPALAQERIDRNGQCVGDRNSDVVVNVDELVTAVNNAIDGCPHEPVEIRFEARVGDEPFACGSSYSGIGTNDAEITPSDFRVFVHDVRLITKDGRTVPVALEQDGIWQLENLALLDFEDASSPCNNGTTQTNASIRGMVPPGDYRGIRFTVGVPFAMNHQEPALAPPPLSLTAMFWSWQAGFKYIRIDDRDDGMRVHTGSTGCQVGDQPNVVDFCLRPNRPEIILPDFDPAVNIIVADLAALLQDTEIGTNQPETPPGCMGGPDDLDCAPLLPNLGLNHGNGLPNPSSQTFFRVE